MVSSPTCHCDLESDMMMTRTSCSVSTLKPSVAKSRRRPWFVLPRVSSTSTKRGNFLSYFNIFHSSALVSYTKPAYIWPPDLCHESGSHILPTLTPSVTRHAHSSHKKAKRVAAAATGVPLSISGPPSKRWWPGDEKGSNETHWQGICCGPDSSYLRSPPYYV